MITIQQETDQNNKNTKNDDDDDDCVIVDNPLYKFKELRTHKEITDGLKAKLIVDDQEVSHHFYCLDNDYVNPKQAVNDYNQYSIHLLHGRRSFYTIDTGIWSDIERVIQKPWWSIWQN